MATPPRSIAPSPARPAGESTVREAARAFDLDLAARRVSPLTREGYARDLRLLEEFTKNAPVAEITPWTLKSFVAWVTERRVGGRRLSAKTVSRTITAVRSFFAFLTAERVVKENAAERALVPTNPPSTLERPLGEDQVRTCFAAWSKSPKQYVMGCLLMAGLDRREILNVTAEDIDLANRFRPEVVVRGRRPERTRRAELAADFAAAYERFRAEANPGAGRPLFDFSERAFNFLLEQMGRDAGLGRALTARTCLNTYIARAVKRGMSEAEIIRGLGRAPTKFSPRIRRKIQAIRTMEGLR